MWRGGGSVKKHLDGWWRGCEVPALVGRADHEPPLRWVGESGFLSRIRARGRLCAGTRYGQPFDGLRMNGTASLTRVAHATPLVYTTPSNGGLARAPVLRSDTAISFRANGGRSGVRRHTLEDAMPATTPTFRILKADRVMDGRDSPVQTRRFRAAGGQPHPRRWPGRPDCLPRRRVWRGARVRRRHAAARPHRLPHAHEHARHGTSR